MDFLYIFLLAIISMGAGFIQRVTGFGLGIFVMLFFPHFMPSHTLAAAVSCLLSCYSSSYNAVKYRKNISFKTAIPLFLAAMFAIPIAVHFSSGISKEFFEKLLAVVLIALSIYFLVFSKRISIRPNIINGVFAGALGGTLNGLFSTGGPPVVLYLTGALKNKTEYFATIQFYFCMTNIYATVVRAINGIVTPQVLLYSVIGFIGCITGDSLGVIVFNKLNSEKLKIVIYFGMIISGILMMI